MKKEFSKSLEQDRDFEFAGEIFKWKPMHWEVLGEIAQEETNGTDTTVLGVYRSIAERIPLFIDGDSEGVERMTAALKGDKGPVPVGLMQDLYSWLLEVTSGRPTEQPSPSAPGRGRTAPSSKGA